MKKLDPSGFEGTGELGQGVGPGLGGAALKIGNGFLRNSRVPHEIVLRPVEEGAGGTTLGGIDRHRYAPVCKGSGILFPIALRLRNSQSPFRLRNSIA